MANDVGISPLQEAKGPLSDDHLVSRLRMLCRWSKRTEVEIISLLVVLQARHLDLHWTYSSLYKFCAERLGMTEGEAARRVAAARLIAKVPALLDYLRAGQLSMTTLLCLRNHVTSENANELLASVASKSKREVQLVLAERRPDLSPRRRQSAGIERHDEKASAPSPTESVGHRLDVVSGSTLHTKIELARELMGQPADGLIGILNAALDALLAQLRADSSVSMNSQTDASLVAEGNAAVVAMEPTVSARVTSVPPKARSSARRVRQPPKGSRRTSSREESPTGRDCAGVERSQIEKPSAISQALRRPLNHPHGAKRARERDASRATESMALRRASRSP